MIPPNSAKGAVSADSASLRLGRAQRFAAHAEVVLLSKFLGDDLVTATVKPLWGVKYKLTAKLGRKTKTGKCKKKRGKLVCTLAPGRGKWKFSITPRNAGGPGKPNAKAVKL